MHGVVTFNFLQSTSYYVSNQLLSKVKPKCKCSFGCAEPKEFVSMQLLDEYVYEK